DQPTDRRRPDPRRRRPGRRRRSLRADGLRRRRPAGQRVLHGLPHALRQRGPRADRDRPPGDPLPAQPARHQRRGRGRRHPRRRRPRRRHRGRRGHPHHLHAPLPIRPVRPPPHPGDGVMKISGSATLHAPPAKVWTTLNDPAVLARAIPGCEQLEAAGPDSYRLTMTTGVASIQGTYTGKVSLTDRHEPTSSRLALNMAGAPGTLDGSVLVVLVPSGNGSTEVTYAADAIPDGMIAGVGQRLLAGTVKKLASDFFASLDELLVASEAPAQSAAPPPDG